ncbi:MAG: inositol monophosphatase [Clostridia bacterium]|nr:inositol monophosphatase [Clostridia bacterium]
MISQILDTVREAGEIVLSADKVRCDPEKLGIVNKGTASHDFANLVTEYDSRVQAFLVEKLGALLPEAQFIGEEDGVFADRAREGLCFVIDPIDGTTNFVVGMNRSAVSVGIMENGKPLFGAILNPYTGDLYHAIRGRGAYMNNNRIHVSDEPLERSIAVMGTSPYYKAEIGEKTVEMFKRLLYTCADVRRFASASLDICDVASGRVAAFCEGRLSPWDFAAGAVILTEAGGYITDFSGNELQLDTPSSVLCTTPATKDKMLELLSDLQ